MNKYLILLSFFILVTCVGAKHKNIELTDKKIEAYLNAYKELKRVAPEILEKVNAGETDEQISEFKHFDNILNNNNLTYSDFIVINAKVGAIYSILQAEMFINSMDTLQNWGQNNINDGIHQIREAINDPEVPEETKKELRESLTELEAMKKTIKKDYTNNKHLAELVLEKTKSITNLIIEERDIQAVERYFEVITETYTGGIIPIYFKIN
jgi:hypothetical protein